ncbi:hypothetical protein D3C75_1015650 [compost metagenome]
MLLCKYRCWYQYCNLLPFDCRLESCTDGYLCFSISNVAAQKTVHRASLFHILLDFFNRTDLVTRFLIWKHIFKFLLLWRILLKRVAWRSLAICVQLDQIICNIFDG